MIPCTNLFGRQGKYLLRPNDIVFIFRGAPISVGMVGFVEEVGAPAITGPTMCIIRALPGMDTVGLYSHLQREDGVGLIRSRAGGSSLLTVNPEPIRELPVEFPCQWEINDINEEHGTMPETTLKGARLHEECRDALGVSRNSGNRPNIRAAAAQHAANAHKIRGSPETGQRGMMSSEERTP